MKQEEKLVELINQHFDTAKIFSDDFLKSYPYILEECETGKIENYLANQMIYVLKYCQSRQEPRFFSHLLFHLNEYSKCKNPKVAHLNIFRDMTTQQQHTTLTFLEYLISPNISNWVLGDNVNTIQKTITRFQKQVK